MTKQTTPKMKSLMIRNSEKHLCIMMITKALRNLKKNAVKKKNIVVDINGSELHTTPYPDCLPKNNVDAAIYLMQKN